MHEAVRVQAARQKAQVASLARAERAGLEAFGEARFSWESTSDERE